MFYSTLLWVHILCAITALGANITYFPWLFRVGKNPQSLGFTLRTIKLLDDWIANPAYILALFTGDALIRYADPSEGFSYKTPWIVGALILYALVSVLGLFVYSPLLKKQIKLAERVGADAPEYKRAANTGMYVGFAIVTVTIFITFLMAVKPQLW
jgi:uncharacterized membrane protein